MELKKNLQDFLIFSLGDVRKIDPYFHRQRLNEWQHKGYIKKVINEYYIFSDLEINESVLFIIANKIFDHSYISLEIALSFHGLIPESVYSITSVTSRKTHTFHSPIAQFSYRKIKPELMFGYQLVSYQNHTFKVAEIEKSFLDFFYINPKLKTEGEFEELRINKDTFHEKVSMDKLNDYLSHFHSKALEKRVNQFINYLNA